MLTQTDQDKTSRKLESPPLEIALEAAGEMDASHRMGTGRSISYAGGKHDLPGVSSGTSGGTNRIKAIRGSAYLLLGVTGGIATGKTTVVKMLKEKGAPVIDFDLLARVVVEPGKKAYQDIVDYFGRQILQEDGALDRKKLRSIVFRDEEKRKKLESFQHPQIEIEFNKRLTEIISKNQSAIVQIDVPLMIETNMQNKFHRLLVVYAPEKVQIERLVKRDGISREDAVQTLMNQIPIEEKLTCADFVIDNSSSLEETKKQGDELWKKLKQIKRG